LIQPARFTGSSTLTVFIDQPPSDRTAALSPIVSMTTT